MLDMYYKYNDSVHTLSWGVLIKDLEGPELVQQLYNGCRQPNSLLPNGSGVIPDFSFSNVSVNEDSNVFNFVNNTGNDSATVELFLDSNCEKPSGFTMEHKIVRNAHEVYLYPTKYSKVYFGRKLMVARLVIKSLTEGKYYFVSPYASVDGTLASFMKNMWAFENQQFKDGTPSEVFMMGNHCCSTPFAVIADNTIGIKFHVVGDLAYSPAVSHVWDNYASHYTVIYDAPLVPVDNMVMGGKTFRPACLYSPKYVEAWNWSDYGYDSVITRDQNEIPTGISTVSVNYKDDSGASTKEISRFLAPYVQIPSVLIGGESGDDWTDIINFRNKNANDVKFIYTSADNNKLAAIGITEIPAYNYGLNTMCFAQLTPFNNFSKIARDAGDSADLWKYKIGDDNYIPPIIGLSLVFDSDINAGIVNMDDFYQSPACMALFTYNDSDPLTGSEIFEYFYSNQLQDWNPPSKPSEIPDDDGNGGFNDQDHLGGDGVWSDTTVDMTPDRDSPIWNIPDNLGLDGNYTIVKMKRDAVESLASQTWTEKSWLSYALSFSGISRTADGIADIKTCFCDIPSTGEANVVAIAGFRIKEPIACNKVNQYNEFNMGSVDVPVYFGSFLDYAPYTEIVLELPFAQPVNIPPEIVVGKSVAVKLYVDLMSNTAMYIVHCDGRLIAQVPANIFITLPFGSSEFTQSALSAVSSYVANAGGIGGRVGSSAVAGSMHGQNAISAGAKSASRMMMQMPSANVAGIMDAGIKVASGAVNSISNMESGRNITQISEGGGAGAIGAMGVKYATLKISRPYVTIPPRYYELNGCPSGFVKKVGDCSGYLEVEQIYGSIPCNTEEFAAITDVLANGIFP